MISTEKLEQIYFRPDLLNLNNVELFSPHDRASATADILRDNNWHNNMIRNVASLVSDGRSDEEIHSITDEYTLPGYTLQDTRLEVQKAIDGARVKGFSKLDSELQTKSLLTKGALLRPISDGDVSSTEHLVKGLIEDATLSLLFGAPASGKSFIAMNLACSIASGTPFFGREVKSGPVIYIAGEGRRGLRKRAYAWSRMNGFDWGRLSVLLSERSVGLLNASELVSLMEEIDKNVPKHGEPVLIIVDTLNRNFGGGDENSNADMGNFIKSLEHLQNRYNCSVLIVHHSGHSEAGRVRGASALTAAVDAEYFVKMRHEFIEMSCTKMKDDEAPQKMYFQLLPLPVRLSGVLLGESLAVLQAATNNQSFGEELSKRYKLGMETLNEAEDISGEQINKYGPKSVPEEKWREVYFKRSPADSYEAKRKAFSRAKTSLVNEGLIEVNDNYYTRKER